MLLPSGLSALLCFGSGNVRRDAPESGSIRVIRPRRDLPEACRPQRREGERVDAVVVEADVVARRH